MAYLRKQLLRCASIIAIAIFSAARRLSLPRFSSVNHLNHFRRIAGNDDIIGDVMCDDRTGSNNHTVTDGDTRTNNHSAAQPAVIADAYRQTCFYGLTPLQIIMRMVRCQQLTVGPDKRVRADSDTSAIQEDPIKIDKRTFAYADSVTVVAMEWWHDDH